MLRLQGFVMRSSVLCLLVYLFTLPPAHGKCSKRWLKRKHGWDCTSLAPNYDLYWRARLRTAEPSSSSMEFGVDVIPVNGMSQLGWIGLGLSEGGGMPGADIALLRRDSSSPSSAWLLEDRFATGFATPQLDRQQDKKLLSFQEDRKGRIRARFSMLLRSNDTQQDRWIDAGLELPMIYAFGSGGFEYHGTMNRGQTSLTLLPAGPAKTKPDKKDKDSRSLLLAMPSITIPTDDSDPYMCLTFQLPGSSSKPYHVTHLQPVVNTSAQGGSQAVYTHHMVLYNCSGRPASLGAAPFRCEQQVRGCAAYVMAAASGTQTVQLPSEAGMRMGDGAMKYVVLQVHYNNVNLDKGLLDASGFRLTYTPHLRPNDVGVFKLGWEFFNVPAATPSWSTGPSICSPACTSRFKRPINVLGTILHMHRLGSSMSAQHVTFSNGSAMGQELRPFGVRQYYDFSYQPLLGAPLETAVVKPGDAILTTCTYNNPTDKEVPFGLRSSEEMCYNYMFYWPLDAAAGITSCFDVPYLHVPNILDLTFCGDQDVDSKFADLLNATDGTQLKLYQAILEAERQGLLVPSMTDAILNNMTAYKPVP